MESIPVPVGLCQCGCGQSTKIAKYSSNTFGYNKGQYVTFVRGHHNRISTEDRFWSKVDKSGGPDSCWIWTGSYNKKGYGVFSNNYSNQLAHRYSYELIHSSIPDGLLVCHSCDNPPCVNPAHLWLGTHKDNSQDALNKERLAVGEKSSNSRLTEREVLEIRISYTGIDGDQSNLARKYGVNRLTIRAIVNRKTWKHLTD